MTSKKKRTLFVVPGFWESTKSGRYDAILESARKKGYAIKCFTPKWKWRTLSHWIEEFETYFLKHKGEYNHALGFSMGAQIILLKAEHFQRMLLCSTSPFFSETISKIPAPDKNALGKRRIQDFNRYSLPKHIKNSAVIFVGNKEPLLMRKHAQHIFDLLKGQKHLEIIEGAHHDISDPLYSSAVKKFL